MKQQETKHKEIKFGQMALVMRPPECINKEINTCLIDYNNEEFQCMKEEFPVQYKIQLGK